MAFLKKILVFGIIAAVLYMLLGYHYIIVDKLTNINMLKKSKLTLKYTVFSTKGKRPEAILKIPELWEDGIGELLVEEGKISRAKLELYEDKMEKEEYD